MKSTIFNVVRYDADETLVFDWVEPRYVDVLDEHNHVIGQEQDHLYAKTLFIGGNDNIENYKEVPESDKLAWDEAQKAKLGE